MKRITLLSSALFVLLAITGAQASDNVSAFCASTTKAPMTEIVQAYEKAHPGTKIDVVYTGAQVIRTNIASDTRVDLVVVGEPTTDAVADKIELGPIIYSLTEAVLVPRGSKKIRSLKDLATPGLKLVGPSRVSPVYGYMEKMLKKASAEYGPDFQKKVEDNIVITKATSAEIPAAIAAGLVDGGVGFMGDETDKVEAIRPPAAFDVITKSHVSYLKTAANASGARAFGAFLVSAEAKAIFKKHHVETP